MSKANLHKRLDRIAPTETTEVGQHPGINYVVTADVFATLCGSLRAVFEGPPPDKKENYESWLQYFSVYENGKLVEPLPERIAWRTKWGLMTQQDWYESQLKDLLRFRHRIDFDLREFGLEEWVPKVKACELVEYRFD